MICYDQFKKNQEIFCCCFEPRQLSSAVSATFSIMAANKIVKISFQEAYQVMKDNNFIEKRKSDQGKSDKEIVEDILLHYGVELIKIWDENMDPEKHVSCIIHLIFSWF